MTLDPDEILSKLPPRAASVNPKNGNQSDPLAGLEKERVSVSFLRALLDKDVSKILDPKTRARIRSAAA